MLVFYTKDRNIKMNMTDKYEEDENSRYFDNSRFLQTMT